MYKFESEAFGKSFAFLLPMLAIFAGVCYSEEATRLKNLCLKKGDPSLTHFAQTDTLVPCLHPLLALLRMAYLRNWRLCIERRVAAVLFPQRRRVSVSFTESG